MMIGRLLFLWLVIFTALHKFGKQSCSMLSTASLLPLDNAYAGILYVTVLSYYMESCFCYLPMQHLLHTSAHTLHLPDLAQEVAIILFSFIIDRSYHAFHGFMLVYWLSPDLSPHKRGETNKSQKFLLFCCTVLNTLNSMTVCTRSVLVNFGC